MTSYDDPSNWVATGNGINLKKPVRRLYKRGFLAFVFRFGGFIHPASAADGGLGILAVWLRPVLAFFISDHLAKAGVATFLLTGIRLPGLLASPDSYPQLYRLPVS